MKFLFLLTPVGSIIAGAVVFQQAKMTLSPELTITVLVNVALIAMAWGGIKAEIRHLRADVNRIEHQLERRRQFRQNEEEES